MHAVSRLQRLSDHASLPCPSGAASFTSPTPTLLARAGVSLPPGAGPPSPHDRLAALLDEVDELLVPHARRAVEQLGYAVATGAAASGACDATPVATGCLAARFVGVHGLEGVAGCRLKRRSSLPECAAAFTVVYVVRDEVAAALHRLHRCADVVVVLRHTPGGWQFQHVPWPSLFDHAGVTAREADVLALLLARRTNAEIAQELVVSPATVRAHCRSLFCKLAAAGRRDLWARFARLGECVAYSARSPETRNAAASTSRNPAQTAIVAR